MTSYQTERQSSRPYIVSEERDFSECDSFQRFGSSICSWSPFVISSCSEKASVAPVLGGNYPAPCTSIHQFWPFWPYWVLQDWDGTYILFYHEFRSTRIWIDIFHAMVRTCIQQHFHFFLWRLHCYGKIRGFHQLWRSMADDKWVSNGNPSHNNLIIIFSIMEK